MQFEIMLTLTLSFSIGMLDLQFRSYGHQILNITVMIKVVKLLNFK